MPSIVDTTVAHDIDRQDPVFVIGQLLQDERLVCGGAHVDCVGAGAQGEVGDGGGADLEGVDEEGHCYVSLFGGSRALVVSGRGGFAGLSRGRGRGRGKGGRTISIVMTEGLGM